MIKIKKIHTGDGDYICFVNDANQIHRINGPAVEWIEGKYTGSKYWLQNGIYHRADGPAIVRYYGERRWFFNGKLHRLDGPAFDDIEPRWYYHGKQIECKNQKEFERLIKLIALW